MNNKLEKFLGLKKIKQIKTIQNFSNALWVQFNNGYGLWIRTLNLSKENLYKVDVTHNDRRVKILSPKKYQTISEVKALLPIVEAR